MSTILRFALFQLYAISTRLDTLDPATVSQSYIGDKRAQVSLRNSPLVVSDC